MSGHFEQWIDDPSEIFYPTFTSCFGGQITIHSPMHSAVHDFVQQNDVSLRSSAKKLVCTEALAVTKRQLSDFLGDGIFVNVEENVKAKLMHCALTNLIGESAFGDFDFDISKRRNASLHNRSAVHCTRRNQTMIIISGK